jgi:hypothetical protein
VAAKKKKRAAAKTEPEPSPRVQALREILALRVKREPIPVELRDLDDMRFTSRRRVHAVLQAMHRDDAGMEEVDAYVAREIRG